MPRHAPETHAKDMGTYQFGYPYPDVHGHRFTDRGNPVDRKLDDIYRKHKQNETTSLYRRSDNRNRGPRRDVSTARLANDIYESKQYANRHAKPDEHIELYGENIEPYYMSPEEHLYFKTTKQDIEDQRKIINDYRNSISDCKAGLHYHVHKSHIVNPTIDEIDIEKLHDPEQYFTGFRFGNNYQSYQYGIDSPYFFDGMDEDKFPEMIENVPYVVGPETSYMDNVGRVMEMRGEFREERARRPNFVTRRYP